MNRHRGSNREHKGRKGGNKIGRRAKRWCVDERVSAARLNDSPTVVYKFGHVQMWGEY